MQHPVAQISWRSIILIMSKCKDHIKALWYIEEAYKMDGVIRFNDFCLNRSNGKIRKKYAYSDTKQVIKEMLKEENMEDKFKNIIDSNDYFPECFFYEWIGYPENVLFNSKNIEDNNEY